VNACITSRKRRLSRSRTQDIKHSWNRVNIKHLCTFIFVSREGESARREVWRCVRGVVVDDRSVTSEIKVQRRIHESSSVVVADETGERGNGRRRQSFVVVESRDARSSSSSSDARENERRDKQRYNLTAHHTCARDVGVRRGPVWSSSRVRLSSPSSRIVVEAERNDLFLPRRFRRVL